VLELMEKLEEHRQFLEKEAEHRKNLLGAEAELTEAIKEKMVSSIIDELKKEGKFEELLQKILKKKIDPASAAEKLLQEKLRRH